MERCRTIANPDELDPSFSVPCRRCAELLQQGNRFCPFCFEDQLAPVDAGDGGQAFKPTGDTRAGPESRSPDGFDFADTLQPDAAEVIRIPHWMDATPGAESDAGMDLVRVEPLWLTEMPEGGKAHWAAHFASPRRMALGIVAVLALIAFAVLGLRPTLEALETDPPPDPGVQTLGDAFDPPAQDTPPVQPQPAPTARETFSALGLDGVAAPPPALPPEASPAVAKKECSEALAAMALCPGK
jgi:hypothetical protein